MTEEFIEDIISGIDEETNESPSLEELAEQEKSSSIETTEETSQKSEEVDNDESQNLTDTDKKSENVTTGDESISVEELAKQLGWREDHEGEDKVDAATYILRSKDIQKSMSQHNKDLKSQLNALTGSVEALKEHNEKVYQADVKRLESEITALKKERREAIELADVDKVEELDNQIAEKQKTIEQPEEKKESDSVENAVYDEWIKDNQWYLDNDEMANYADVVAQQYQGAPLERIYSLVRQKVQEVFPDKFETPKQPEVIKDDIKNPVGPKSPVEGSVKKGNEATFSKTDLSQEQLQIMNQFVRGGIMTEEQYIKDIAKMQS